MTIRILDAETREVISMTSAFISLIWTERFQEYGDFELELPLSVKNIELFKQDRYLQISTSTNLMIIEKLEIKGETLKISGRSLESLLDRRISGEETISTKTPATMDLSIYHSVQNAFNGADPTGVESGTTKTNRRVEYIRPLPYDIYIGQQYGHTELTGTIIARGDIVYDAIKTLVLIDDIGFKMEFLSNLTFQFSLYDGEEKNITFSENTFTLNDPTYKESTQNLKTTAYVAGQGEGTKRTVVELSKTDTVESVSGDKTVIKYTGINRREMWVDARDLQKESGETNANYKLRLKDRGIEKMAGYIKEYSADGTIFNTGKYILKKDYDLGDTIHLKSKFYNAKAKITEVIQSWSSSGYSIYPSFKVTEVEASEIETSYNLG